MRSPRRTFLEKKTAPLKPSVISARAHVSKCFGKRSRKFRERGNPLHRSSIVLSAGHGEPSFPPPHASPMPLFGFPKRGRKRETFGKAENHLFRGTKVRFRKFSESFRNALSKRFGKRFRTRTPSTCRNKNEPTPFFRHTPFRKIWAVTSREAMGPTAAADSAAFV